MSHRQTKDGVTFVCDAEDCPCFLFSSILSIRGAWVEAAKDGWSIDIRQEGGISRMRHLCGNHEELTT